MIGLINSLFIYTYFQANVIGLGFSCLEIARITLEYQNIMLNLFERLN
jgi:hypothetical protein